MHTNRQFPARRVTDARVIADNAEQVAQDVHRTVTAVAAIVDELKVLYGVVSPLIGWLNSTRAGPPAKVQVEPPFRPSGA